MKQAILHIFTRTPLHVGAGASVGAIDQPIIRERHTGLPTIPATSQKGAFADAWNGDLYEQNGEKHLRVTTKKEADREVIDQRSDAAWLFGSDNARHAFAGALQFSEARLLAFPIRSAKGSFAWITSKFLLDRAARDGSQGSEHGGAQRTGGRRAFGLRQPAELHDRDDQGRRRERTKQLGQRRRCGRDGRTYREHSAGGVLVLVDIDDVEAVGLDDSSC